MLTRKIGKLIRGKATRAQIMMAAILGGLLAYALSYGAVFWVAIAFQVVSIAFVVAFVEDPRRTRRVRLEA